MFHSKYQGTCKLPSVGKTKINSSARRCFCCRKWVKLTQDELFSMFKSKHFLRVYNWICVLNVNAHNDQVAWESNPLSYLEQRNWISLRIPLSYGGHRLSETARLYSHDLACCRSPENHEWSVKNLNIDCIFTAQDAYLLSWWNTKRLFNPNIGIQELVARVELKKKFCLWRLN